MSQEEVIESFRLHHAKDRRARCPYPRSARRESGFDVRVVGVYGANVWMPFYHARKLLFLCSITGGLARSSHEIPDVVGSKSWQTHFARTVTWARL